MKTFIAALASGIVYCAACNAGDVPDSLVGQWSIRPGIAVGVSTSCAESTLEFTTDDRLIVTSGALVYSVAIRMRAEDEHLFEIVRVLQYNDQPNCQGIPASFVLSHLAPLIRLQPVGDELTFAMLGADGTPYGPPARLGRSPTLGPAPKASPAK